MIRALPEMRVEPPLNLHQHRAEIFSEGTCTASFAIGARLPSCSELTSDGRSHAPNCNSPRSNTARNLICVFIPHHKTMLSSLLIQHGYFYRKGLPISTDSGLENAMVVFLIVTVNTGFFGRPKARNSNASGWFSPIFGVSPPSEKVRPVPVLVP